MITLATEAHFTWLWGQEFFLETPEGNFVWLDPDYGGDNTIRPANMTYRDFCDKCHVDFGRDKGRHRIIDYCGSDVQIEQYPADHCRVITWPVRF